MQVGSLMILLLFSLWWVWGGGSGWFYWHFLEDLACLASVCEFIDHLPISFQLLYIQFFCLLLISLFGLSFKNLFLIVDSDSL